MTIFDIILLLLAAAAVAGSVVLLRGDGYGHVRPPRSRDQEADDRGRYR